MARFARIDVVRTMCEGGLVPVFYHSDAGLASRVVSACYEGGARTFEFTNRGEFAHEVFGLLRREVEARMPDLALGVGSVVDAATTSLYLQLGADFVVSPILNAEMARACNRRKVLWIPGCATLTEISRGEELGAEIVKIFPGAQVGGPDFVSAVKGPCPWTSIMPTAGVEPTEENLRPWFQAGVVCVGMGSKLITKEILEASDFDRLRDRVAHTLELIRRIRG